jgi:hypothetical protein
MYFVKCYNAPIGKYTHPFRGKVLESGKKEIVNEKGKKQEK